MPKILVIDDEISVRLPIVDLLKLEGFEVLEAADGEAGVELAEEALPDLIICDVMMPRLDGFEVLGTIRKNPALAMTPFIFLTARIENQDTEKGLNLGADDYVPKPFDPTVLIRRIRSRIEKYQTINAFLNQVRENLIGKVPHEFRTPLNGILGFASMMKENALILSPAEVRDFSGLIVESGERMLQTVVNYVKYLELQVDIGKRELPAKYLEAEVDVDTIEIGALLERFYVQFPMRKGDFDVFLLPARIAILEEDFSFIVHQLLDNAVKFSTPNSRVSLNTVVDGDYYVVSVTDQGQGMSKDLIPSLGPFIQLNREQNEQQGLGLGLSIVKALCLIYKGSLTLSSQPGEGTRVILRLPMRR